jgi:universal stress protein A
MRDYERVLAAITVGEEATKVLGRAGSLAGTQGASLTALNVVAFDVPGPEPGRQWPTDELVADLTAAAQGRCEELLRTAGVEGADLMVEAGRVRERIPEATGRCRADLVVLGSHGRHGIGAILGSTAHHVMHRADCDVLVVRTRPTQAAGRVPLPYAHVLAATDFSDPSGMAVRRGARLAELLGARLTLLHVLEHFAVDRSNDEIAPEDQDPAAYESERARDGLARLAGEVGHPDAGREVLLTNWSARHELPRLARERGADLVVVGSHGVRGLGALLGATADGLVHHAECDVLIVRAPG